MIAEQERKDLAEALRLSNECLDMTNSNYTKLNARLKKVEAERDALAAQLQGMREVVQYYWDNGPTSSLYYKARKALVTPDTSAAILARRDAAVWTEAAEVCKGVLEAETRPAGIGAACECEELLHAKADELLKGLEKEHG